jgi:hypothetical protein
MAELGRQGGKARGRKRAEQEGDTRTELAWNALVELLDRLEPLLGNANKAAAVAQAKRELADEFDAATVNAKAKLNDLLARRAAGVRAPGAAPAGSEQWMDELGRGLAAAIAELDRVVVDRSGAEPIVRYRDMSGEETKAGIEGLVEIGLLGWPADWPRFEAHVEEKARELTQEAERRAVEAEAKQAEFTAE